MNLFTASNFPDQRRFVLLAPKQHVHASRPFGSVRRDPREHDRLLRQAQKLRGEVYLADNAIEPWQLQDGLHRQPADSRSFHLLSLDEMGHVVACTRYLPHLSSVEFSQLGVSRSPLGQDRTTRPVFERAVENELERARELGFGYVEMGGWAVAEKLRCSTEAVRMVVTIYALARCLGGALGISTVTTRHASSSILRRLGGSSLLCGHLGEATYFDPNYKCEMEILRFDSNCPSESFEGAIQRCQNMLAKMPVISPKPEEEDSLVLMMNPLAMAAVQ
jgi:hypothetical protein